MDVRKLKRVYEKDFVADAAYVKTLPDLQNTQVHTIPIEMVGIHGFHMPLKLRKKSGGLMDINANITGTVSLEAEKKGINMSRIIRTAYKNQDSVFDINELCKVLDQYKKDLESFDAHITMSFDYYLWQEALRTTKEDGTKEGGWQYYQVSFDVDLDKNGKYRKVMWLDFVYSSACPCSTELSLHAAETRDVYGIPHSQRSVARIGVEMNDMIWIEDLVDLCRETLTTETLVFCKRQDEQAFAEKNGAQPKFVEDAVRMLGNAIGNMPGVGGFKLIVSHLESLHSHDAIAVMVSGDGFTKDVSVDEWKSLKR